MSAIDLYFYCLSLDDRFLPGLRGEPLFEDVLLPKKVLLERVIQWD